MVVIKFEHVLEPPGSLGNPWIDYWASSLGLLVGKIGWGLRVGIFVKFQGMSVSKDRTLRITGHVLA
jgi:hypothetical protein